jgi:hypothetical protein
MQHSTTPMRHPVWLGNGFRQDLFFSVDVALAAGPDLTTVLRTQSRKAERDHRLGEMFWSVSGFSSAMRTLVSFVRCDSTHDRLGSTRLVDVDMGVRERRFNGCRLHESQYEAEADACISV